MTLIVKTNRSTHASPATVELPVRVMVSWLRGKVPHSTGGQEKTS